MLLPGARPGRSRVRWRMSAGATCRSAVMLERRAVSSWDGCRTGSGGSVSAPNLAAADWGAGCAGAASGEVAAPGDAARAAGARGTGGEAGSRATMGAPDGAGVACEAGAGRMTREQRLMQRSGRCWGGAPRSGAGCRGGFIFAISASYSVHARPCQPACCRLAGSRALAVGSRPWTQR